MIYEDPLHVKLSENQLSGSAQCYTFQYFWNGAKPNAGMAPSRIHLDGIYCDNDQHIFISGATGIGLIEILGRIVLGCVSRGKARIRFEKMIKFLVRADRRQRIGPHWLGGEIVIVKPFRSKDNESDLVESEFLILGLLVVREYFKSKTIEEKILGN